MYTSLFFIIKENFYKNLTTFARNSTLLLCEQTPQGLCNALRDAHLFLCSSRDKTSCCYGNQFPPHVLLVSVYTHKTHHQYL